MIRDNQLIQVKLHNECCEELGTRLNFGTLNIDLNFRETISHADDLRYTGVKVRDLERHGLEHKWKEKHSIIRHGYSIVLYKIIGLLCFYVAFLLVRCMMSNGTCQRVVGALKITPRLTANPESAGWGNVVSMNIETSSESLTNTPENITLRALKPSDSKTGGSETRPTHCLRPSRTYFYFRPISRVKLVFPHGGRCCMPSYPDHEGHFGHLYSN